MHTQNTRAAQQHSTAWRERVGRRGVVAPLASICACMTASCVASAGGGGGGGGKPGGGGGGGDGVAAALAAGYPSMDPAHVVAAPTTEPTSDAAPAASASPVATPAAGAT